MNKRILKTVALALSIGSLGSMQAMQGLRTALSRLTSKMTALTTPITAAKNQKYQLLSVAALTAGTATAYLITTQSDDRHREVLPATINTDQLASFLERWPICKENEKTQNACNKAREDLGFVSPRVKKDTAGVVQRFQIAAQLVNNKPEDAQKRTQEDLANFLAVEYNVDSLADINEKKYPELVKFYKRYGLPHTESTWITKNTKKSYNSYSRRDELNLPFGEMQGREKFFIKNNDIHRIINAERARNFIAQAKIDRLDIAQKYLGFFDGCFKVIAENIKSHDKSHFTLEEVKQLTQFVEETGYRDWTGYNWTFDEQGKFVCFDTDDGGFAVGRVHGGQDGIPWNCKLIYVVNLRYMLGAQMNEDALAWITARANELMDSPEGLAEHTPIFRNSKYDTPGMDFERVKKDFIAWQQEKYA